MCMCYLRVYTSILEYVILTPTLPEWKKINPQRIRQISRHYVALRLAYSGWARSAIGSQNFGVLPKRYDNSLFLRTNKNKNSEQVPLASSSS